LLAEEARDWHLASFLSNIICEPTKQSLKMMQTIAANETLRPLIKSFICVGDDRCYRGILEFSGFIPDTVSVAKQFPNRKGFTVTWKRSTNMFAKREWGILAFHTWFWNAVGFVNEAERDHTLRLHNVQTSFLQPRIVHEELDEIMANVTVIVLDFEPASTLFTKEEIHMCWGPVLQKARRLETFHLDVSSLSWKEATHIWKGILKGQYWPCLDQVTLSGPVIHEVVKDFLLANRASLYRINMIGLVDPCARTIVESLDFLLMNLPIFEALILVPTDDIFDDDCNHRDEWEAIVDELAERDGPSSECGLYDVGFYVVRTEECYYDNEEEHWQAVLSDDEDESK